MKQTTNYGFNMPESTDFVEIDKLNENTEKLDAELANLDDKKADALVDTTTGTRYVLGVDNGLLYFEEA